MSWIWALLLIVVNGFWLALVVLGLPGTWLMVLTAAVVLWWQWPCDTAAPDPMIGIATLIVLTLLALIGELLEFFAGVVGANKAGATKKGSVGALLGGLAGAVAGTFLIPIPVVGSLIGAAAGAAAGAWGFELAGGRKMRESMKAGLGAGAGRVFGTIFKTAAGVAMWIILTVAILWP